MVRHHESRLNESLVRRQPCEPEELSSSLKDELHIFGSFCAENCALPLRQVAPGRDTPKTGRVSSHFPFILETWLVRSLTARR